ncbi:hypothetical protein C8R43DRAFT_1139449 [Mycena crocata]|nr:hypothetical protein C8R43DRAFT_1139449 [Mycena crocata]
MHPCQICNKEFPRPSALATHMNIHNGVKPFECGFPGCPKTFSVRSNATRHTVLHTQTTPSAPPAPPRHHHVNRHFIQDIPTPVHPSLPPLARFHLRWNELNEPVRNRVNALAEQ